MFDVHDDVVDLNGATAERREGSAHIVEATRFVLTRNTTHAVAGVAGGVAKRVHVRTRNRDAGRRVADSVSAGWRPDVLKIS